MRLKGGTVNWIGKSFGQQEDDRVAALAEAGAKFDEAKKHLMSMWLKHSLTLICQSAVTSRTC